MAFPSPNVTVPTLSRDQFSYQGLTFGAGGPFWVSKVDGLDKPNVRKSNPSRPPTRGSYVGTNVLDTRTINFTLDIAPPFGDYGDLAGACKALYFACSTEGTTEYPLWIQLGDFSYVACMARVIKSTAPYGIAADIGSIISDVAVQFEATDPYLYSAPTLAPSVGLPIPGGNFNFSFGFNISFGGGYPNTISATNYGDVPCYPTLVIAGPVTTPSVQNTSVAGGPTLTYDIQMFSGDKLYIDLDYGEASAIYFPSGSPTGANIANTLAANSSAFAIQPGNNTLVFTSGDNVRPNGTLTLWYASAFDGLIA